MNKMYHKRENLIQIDIPRPDIGAKTTSLVGFLIFRYIENDRSEIKKEITPVSGLCYGGFYERNNIWPVVRRQKDWDRLVKDF